ncbi:hypothetical protein UMZ34_17955 [Halopseudomonas pachastrellae]|nr:hypothetical protein UMZ34_17955 [Halopseudomonas pachastrellae]
MLLHAFFASVKEQAGVEIRQLRGSVDALDVELKVASFASWKSCVRPGGQRRVLPRVWRAPTRKMAASAHGYVLQGRES